MSQTISVVTIDGPVAAGKTMAGREVAKRLNFRYLDTGVMYRAITWLALRDSVPTEDEEALGALTRNNPISLDGQSSDRVLVAGISIGPELRESEVDNHVSLVSRVSAVRVALVHQQRSLAVEGKIVMVGRDIGTVVLPQADMKIFMTASLEERARRRWRELLAYGNDADYQRVMGDTKARDDLDTHRVDSPLKPAGDAWLLDTDGRSGDEVVELILERINRLNNEGRAWA